MENKSSLSSKFTGNVTLPDSVTSIGTYAIQMMTSYTYYKR